MFSQQTQEQVKFMQPHPGLHVSHVLVIVLCTVDPQYLGTKPLLCLAYVLAVGGVEINKDKGICQSLGSSED